ncbi:MAG: DUF222 domain-containing protein, partial [Nocardioidaceae bacterium]
LRIAEEQTVARLRACVLAATREIDARGAAVGAGAASTAAWLRARLGQHPGAATVEVRLAGAPDHDLPVLSDALAAGEVSYEGARVVADAMRRLPKVVDAATRVRGETYLVRQARQFDPVAVGRLGAHLVSVLDPTQGRDLEREEARRADNEAFTVGHGLHDDRPLRGRLDAEHGALLDDALQVLAAPRRAADGTPDPRSAEKRRADALMQLITWGLASADMPTSGGEPVTMTVVTTPEHLQTRTDDTTVTRYLDDAPGHGADGPTVATEMDGTDGGNDGDDGDGKGSDTGSDTGSDDDDGQDSDDGTGNGDADTDAHAGTDADALGDGADDKAPALGAHLADGTPLSPEATRRLGCDAWSGERAEAVAGAGRCGHDARVRAEDDRPKDDDDQRVHAVRAR